MKRIKTTAVQLAIAGTALIFNAQSLLAQDVIANTGRNVHTALNQWANDWSPVGWGVGIAGLFFGARGRMVSACSACVTLALTHIDQIHTWLKGF
jgi:hypothetical protein